jgi:hypothetical protein
MSRARAIRSELEPTLAPRADPEYRGAPTRSGFRHQPGLPGDRWRQHERLHNWNGDLTVALREQRHFLDRGGRRWSGSGQHSGERRRARHHDRCHKHHGFGTDVHDFEFPGGHVLYGDRICVQPGDGRLDSTGVLGDHAQHQRSHGDVQQFFERPSGYQRHGNGASGNYRRLRTDRPSWGYRRPGRDRGGRSLRP